MSHRGVELENELPAVGVLLPTRDVIASGQDVSEVSVFARLAEEMGFESVWVGDSIVARPRLDPLVTLAYVAGETRRVRLGTAVLIAGQRNPVQLAHATATLQRLSQGRLLLGVGTGPNYGPTKKEYAALGVPFERRLGRLLEVMHVCRRLWLGEEISIAGEFVTIPRAHIEPAPTSVPVLLGSATERGLHVVAESMEGWLPMPKSIDGFRQDVARLQAALTTQPRDRGSLGASAYLTMCLVEDTESGREQALKSLEAYYGQPAKTISALSDLFVGSAPQAADWMHAYASAGATRLIIRLVGPQPRRQLETLRSAVLLMRERGSDR